MISTDSDIHYLVKMWHLIVLCALLILCPHANGQSQNGAKQLLDKASQLRLTDFDSSNWYATEALRTALEYNLDPIARKAQLLLGMNLQSNGNLDGAVSIYQQMLESMSDEGYPEEIIQAYGRIGDCYADLGVFDSAMIYLIKFDQLVDQYWSPEKIDAKLLLSELYWAMGRNDKSAEYNIEAINRAERSGNDLELTIALYYYLDNHKHELHTEIFQTYFEDYVKLLNDQNSAALDFSHASMLLGELDTRENLSALEHALEISRERGHLTTTLMYQSTLIEHYLDKQQYRDALPHAEAGLEIASQGDDKRFLTDFHWFLFRIHEGLGNYVPAIQNLRSHHQVRDSLESVQVSRNIDELNIQYETARREKQISEQNLALQKSKTRQNMLIGGLAAVLWSGAFLVLYFWNRNRMTRRLSVQEAAIQQQEIQRLQDEKRILGMQAMLQGQEDERERIARDLHDGLGGLLSNVKAHFYVIQEQLEKLEKIDAYHTVNTLIDKAGVEIRRIAHNMAPQALKTLGLQAAISDICHDVQASQDLRVINNWYGSHDRFAEQSEVMLYRIVQELINNVVKHANAQTLTVQVNRFDDRISITIEDDGSGFMTDSDHAHAGFGLESVRSRVDFLGGQSELDATPGEGTTWIIDVPI